MPKAMWVGGKQRELIMNYAPSVSGFFILFFINFGVNINHNQRKMSKLREIRKRKLSFTGDAVDWTDEGLYNSLV
jgi:hypothetical protein